MTEVRRVLAADGAGRISVIEEPLPEPATGQVLVEGTRVTSEPVTDVPLNRLYRLT